MNFYDPQKNIQSSYYKEFFKSDKEIFPNPQQINCDITN